MSLHTPDFEGASRGENDFHLYLDACNYGVGAGLFQAPASAAQEILSGPYGVLRVTPLVYPADQPSPRFNPLRTRGLWSARSSAARLMMNRSASEIARRGERYSVLWDSGLVPFRGCR